ncbi:MAG TPA: hypothetical protein VFH62_07395 [Dehalococcoidia bacterium]|jgi:hypothetical protein|nr:hypothetical protein [Dehalococcoidia bacterium]
MNGKELARITTRDFDRARLEMLRDLTGAEPAYRAEPDASAGGKATPRRGSQDVLRVVMCALAMR